MTTLTDNADLVASGLISSGDLTRLTDPHDTTWTARHTNAYDHVVRQLAARADPILIADLTVDEQAALKPAIIHYCLYVSWLQAGTQDTLERARHHHQQHIKEMNAISYASSPAGGWGRGIPMYRT